ncbi:hypothetical protein IJG14_07510 [bacterium]|nr:hypothetical protein [bacterium]
MINLILLFPILACFIIFLFKNKNLSNMMITLYAIIHLVTSGLIGLGIIPELSQNKFFAIDNLNKIFLIVLSIVYMAVAIYNNEYMKNENINKLRHYAYAVLLFIFSMTGAILSTNLGIMWIFIEGTTLASAYLIYFHKTKHSIEAAWKYVFICSIGIALAFVGIILLTVATGNLSSLYWADLYKNAHLFNPFWLKMAFVFIMFGIGTKMGLAPVHFWLPDAHAEAPSPISALLSATLLNSAFLMILNVFKITILAGCDGYARLMLSVMGFLSLFIAAVFVYHINNYKRMLAYSSVENMGILAIGTALGGNAMIAVILHLIGHSFIKASFFLTSGNILKIYDTKKIKSITGLMITDKKTGWLWLLSFIGITALPPSVLFISEFLTIKTMLEKWSYILPIIFLILLTIILYGIGKAVLSMSFGNEKINVNRQDFDNRMYVPQFVLIILAFILGLYIPQDFSNIIYNAVIGF